MEKNIKEARQLAKEVIPYWEEFQDHLAIEVDYALETHGKQACFFQEDVFEQFKILDEEVTEARAEVTRSGKRGDKNRAGYISPDRKTNFKMEIMQVVATCFQMYAAQRQREDIENGSYHLR